MSDYSQGLTPKLKEELWRDMVDAICYDEIKKIKRNKEYSNEEKDIYLLLVEEKRERLYKTKDEDE